jgi:hypothetical protein
MEVGGLTMSISLRKFRVLLYNFRDAGSGGLASEQYVRQSSGAGDHSWWASKSNPTGEEVTTGMKADHRVDAVFGFAGTVLVTENSALVCDSVEYLVRAVLPRDYGRDELLVYAERVTAPLTRVNS